MDPRPGAHAGILDYPWHNSRHVHPQYVDVLCSLITRLEVFLLRCKLGLLRVLTRLLGRYWRFLGVVLLQKFRGINQIKIRACLQYVYVTVSRSHVLNATLMERTQTFTQFFLYNSKTKKETWKTVINFFIPRKILRRIILSWALCRKYSWIYQRSNISFTKRTVT